MEKFGAAAFAVALLLGTAALADSPVIFASARVQDGPQAAGFLGTHQAGLSFTFARYGAELAFQYFDRRVELRGGWRLELLRGPVFAAWRVCGGALFGFAPFDLGAGASTGLSAGVGGDPWEAYLGAEAGVETRVRDPLSFPLRGILGVRVRAEWFDLSVQARWTVLPPVPAPSRIEGVLLLSRLL